MPCILVLAEEMTECIQTRTHTKSKTRVETNLKRAAQPTEKTRTTLPSGLGDGTFCSTSQLSAHQARAFEASTKKGRARGPSRTDDKL